MTKKEKDKVLRKMEEFIDKTGNNLSADENLILYIAAVALGIKYLVKNSK